MQSAGTHPFQSMLDRIQLVTVSLVITTTNLSSGNASISYLPNVCCAAELQSHVSALVQVDSNILRSPRYAC